MSIRFIQKKAIGVFFCLFLLLLCSCDCSNNGNPTEEDKTTPKTLETIMKKKVLRVGYVNFPPIIYKDVKSGKVKGHFVLSIEEIAKQIGVKCEYEEATWSTFTAGLKNNDFDISIAPTFGTIPRALSVTFSHPLMYVGNSAIVRSGDKRFQTLNDIDKDGIVVAVAQGEAGHEFAQANIKKAKIVVTSQGDQTLAFSQVLAGRADIALGDAYVTSKFAAEHPKKATDLFAKNPYNLTAVCWAMRSEDIEFINFINTAIGVLESTGKLSEHEQAYDAHWLHLERNWVTY